MIAAFEQTCARIGRKAALGAFASVMIIVGAAFVTVSVWIVLATALSHAHAAAILGMFYLGAGLLVIGVTMRSTPTQNDKPPSGQQSPLIEAFLYGLNAGAKAGKSSKS